MPNETGAHDHTGTGSHDHIGAPARDHTRAGEPPQQEPALTAVQLALYVGWSMAVLYGKIPGPPAHRVPELPTEHELAPAARRELERDRVRHMLGRLAGLPGFTGSGLAADVPPGGADEAAEQDGLEKLNLKILSALGATQPEAQLAYELGRSLRDTVNPPREDPAGEGAPADALARQLARGRVAKLQGWLSALSGQFPANAAAIVATSLGRWSEFAAVTVSAKPRLRAAGDSTPVAATMYEYLLPQGDLWLMLLTGTRPTSGLLTPEGYVAAGEVALRRSAAILRRIVQHYWVWLLVVAAALTGILSLVAASSLSGAGQVWTSIAAIAGSLGVSARAVAAKASSLAAEAEKPVFAMAKEDAMAWAITTLPPDVRLTTRGVLKLRKAGIAPTGGLGRI